MRFGDVVRACVRVMCVCVWGVLLCCSGRCADANGVSDRMATNRIITIAIITILVILIIAVIYSKFK